MMATEKELRQQLADIVQAVTGLQTFHYQPIIDGVEDINALNIDLEAGWACIHIPSSSAKRNDRRLCVEIRLWRNGIINGSGYDATSTDAENIELYLCSMESELVGFSDPCKFKETRGSDEVAGTPLVYVVVSVTITTSENT